MKALTIFSVALSLLALPTGAAADETPQTMAMEVRLGTYQPSIDSEFDDGSKPLEDIFGSESAWMLGAEIDVQLWHGFGSLGVFTSAGWGYLEGKGLSVDGTQASDATTFSLVPVVLGGVYRFDVLATRFNIPLVFALKGGFDYTFWWIRDGLDEVTESVETDKTMPGYGGTYGLHWAASLHLLLDFFEPHTAKVFDNDIGVNNSYLFAEYVGSWVNDFGSDTSFDLSHNGFVFGLAFEM